MLKYYKKLQENIERLEENIERLDKNIARLLITWLHIMALNNILLAVSGVVINGSKPIYKN